MRLRHRRTRVVVNVPDERAATLGADWVPFTDAPVPAISASTVIPDSAPIPDHDLGSEPPPGEATASPGGYGALTAAELRDEVARRGLGQPPRRKADMIALLEAADLHVG